MYSAVQHHFFEQESEIRYVPGNIGNDFWYFTISLATSNKLSFVRSPLSWSDHVADLQRTDYFQNIIWHNVSDPPNFKRE